MRKTFGEEKIESHLSFLSSYFLFSKDFFKNFIWCRPITKKKRKNLLYLWAPPPPWPLPWPPPPFKKNKINEEKKSKMAREEKWEKDDEKREKKRDEEVGRWERTVEPGGPCTMRRARRRNSWPSQPPWEAEQRRVLRDRHDIQNFQTIFFFFFF